MEKRTFTLPFTPGETPCGYSTTGELNKTGKEGGRELSSAHPGDGKEKNFIIRRERKKPVTEGR